MMKKYFYSMLAAGMLFATSCSENELVDVTKGEGQKVTFKVELPGIESRAIDAEGNTFGSGKYADRLLYAMYEENKEDVLITGFADRNSQTKTFTVTVPMAKDIKYDLLFIAYDDENCAFNIDNQTARNNNLKALQLNPDLTANTEQYDAFVGHLESQGITTTGTTSVALKRPFAQVNVGTNRQDLDDIKILKSEVVTSDFNIYNAPNTLNILTDEVSGSETRSYAVEDIWTQCNNDTYPNYETIKDVTAENVTTNDNSYYCLAMSYVLAGKSGSTTHDADFRFYRADGKQVSSIDVLSMPIQANYRTNILGTILTQNEQYEITINPILDGDKQAEPTKRVVANQEDLQKVINNANAPTVIELGGNITFGEGRALSRTATSFINVPTNREITLDLNGYTMSGTCNANQAYLIMVQNGATLTIKDTSDEGTGKITYAGTNSTGWVIDLEGELNLYSGTIELTGTWNIGYAVDVRPNAWGTAYTKPTTFHMYDGKLVSSDGAVRVASSSSETYTDISANFIMDGGEIEAVYDGLFIQQSNTAYDILNVTINGGSIKGDMYPIRLYGPSATSVVGNKKIATTLEINGGNILGGTTDSENRTWLVENTLCIGGGMTNNDLQYTKITIDGKVWIANGLWKKGNEYLVDNANGLATLNEMMINKTAGKNIEVILTADIDFSEKTWTPVNSHADTAFTFSKLDGKGHTISNLKINGQAMFTRFAGFGDVTIKDVTFNNAIVDSNNNINTSILTVQTYQNVLLDNVDVKNSTITGGYKVAPLIATVYDEKPSTITATLKNCDVENVTVKATKFDFCTAGMVAFVYEDAGYNKDLGYETGHDKIVFENCTVKDVKLYAPNVYTAHAAIYTTGSDTLFNEAEGVTVSNVTFENI